MSSVTSHIARLTLAIELAAQAKEWQVVKMLGGQLEALTRAAAGNVVGIEAARLRARR